MTRNEGETSFRKLSASILAITMVTIGLPTWVFGEDQAPAAQDASIITDTIRVPLDSSVEQIQAAMITAIPPEMIAAVQSGFQEPVVQAPPQVAEIPQNVLPVEVIAAENELDALIEAYYQDGNGDGLADGSQEDRDGDGNPDGPPVAARVLTINDVMAVGQVLLAITQETITYPPEAILPIMKFKALSRWRDQLVQLMATGNAAVVTVPMMGELTALRDRLDGERDTAQAALNVYDADTEKGLNDGSGRDALLSQRNSTRILAYYLDSIVGGIQEVQANGMPAADWVTEKKADFQSLVDIQNRGNALSVQMKATGGPGTPEWQALRAQMDDQIYDYRYYTDWLDRSLRTMDSDSLPAGERKTADMMFSMVWALGASDNLRMVLAVFNMRLRDMLGDLFSSVPGVVAVPAVVSSDPNAAPPAQEESPVFLEGSEAVAADTEWDQAQVYARRVLNEYNLQLRTARQMIENQQVGQAISQLANTLWDMGAMLGDGGIAPPMRFNPLLIDGLPAGPAGPALPSVRELYEDAFNNLLHPRGVFIGTGLAGLALSWYIGGGAVPNDKIDGIRGFYERLRNNQDALLASLNQTAEVSHLTAWLVPSFADAARQFFLQTYTDAFAAFRRGGQGNITQVVSRLTETEAAMLRQWGSARLTEAERIGILQSAASRFSNLAALYENATELGVQIAGFNGPDDSPMGTAYGTLTAVIAAAWATVPPDRNNGTLQMECNAVWQRATRWMWDHGLEITSQEAQPGESSVAEVEPDAAPIVESIPVAPVDVVSPPEVMESPNDPQMVAPATEISDPAEEASLIEGILEGIPVV